MEELKKSQAIAQHMYDNDAFSQWMGIQIVSVNPGSCSVKMTVRVEMTNGFLIAHGGITYSLADSAFAFASNGYGQQCVSIETSISHQEAVRTGDELIAQATEIKKVNRLGWYDVVVRNQNDRVVAAFKGTVYRTKKQWNIE